MVGPPGPEGAIGRTTGTGGHDWAARDWQVLLRDRCQLAAKEREQAALIDSLQWQLRYLEAAHEEAVR